MVHLQVIPGYSFKKKYSFLTVVLVVLVPGLLQGPSEDILVAKHLFTKRQRVIYCKQMSS